MAILWILLIVLVIVAVREIFLFYIWLLDLRKARESFRPRLDRGNTSR